MTFEDDFVRLHLAIIGTLNLPLRECGLTWPPPERIVLNDRWRRGGEEPMVRLPDGSDPLDVVLVRTRMSAITDEQRTRMSRVCRGAEYQYGPTN